MYATYHVIRSNTEESMERTQQNFKWPMWLWPLSFWTSKWCVTHCDLMGCVYLIWSELVKYTELQSGQNLVVKTSNDPCDRDLWFSSWKWCATHHPLMCYMYATYEVIRSNKEEATEWTQPKFRPCDHDLLSWKWCATHCDLMGCACIFIWNESVKEGWSYRVGMVKILNGPCDLDLSSWKWCIRS